MYLKKKKKLAGSLGGKVFSRSAGLKLLTTFFFCGRLRSREGNETHFKQFTIGRFT